MNFLIVSSLLLFFVVYVSAGTLPYDAAVNGTLAGTCGGNCPGNDCGSCPCGSSPWYLNIAEWCAKSGWNQVCCLVCSFISFLVFVFRLIVSAL
jgi:hypothetical protein